MVLINNIKEIEELKEINGLSIEDIEKRSKRIQDNTTDKESYQYRSFDGFLGENETFKERLKKDWSLLNDWNQYYGKSITHLDLSNYLSDIIKETERIRTENGYGPMSPIRFSMKIPVDLIDHNSHNNNNNINSRIVQSFEVNINIYNGFQHSLFFNSNNDTLDDNEWNQKWNVDYKIKNLQNNIEITVSGSYGNKGIVKYIRELGFYEGDESNPYRIDPMILISLLTGDIDKFTTNSFQLSHNKEIENINQQIKLLETSSENPEYIKYEINNLRNLISNKIDNFNNVNKNNNNNNK